MDIEYATILWFVYVRPIERDLFIEVSHFWRLPPAVRRLFRCRGGYKSVPQWLNDKAHCLKCDAIVKSRQSLHGEVDLPENLQKDLSSYRAPGEAVRLKDRNFGYCREGDVDLRSIYHYYITIYWILLALRVLEGDTSENHFAQLSFIAVAKWRVADVSRPAPTRRLLAAPWNLLVAAVWNHRTACTIGS